MSSYCAYLGHQPHISIAELSAVFPECRPEQRIGAATLFSIHDELDGSSLKDLGGTWLLAKQLARSPGASLENIPRMLSDLAKGIRGKMTFSIRSEGFSPRDIRDLYKACKDTLKKAGRTGRYVGNERKSAATALLRDERLVNPDGGAAKGGCELVLLRDEDFLWIGRTIAAQDPDAYTKRDMGKPVRDTRAGLLPPKLAQILLNLGAWLAKSDKPALTVLDPFCGTGVIPLECLLRGWPVIAMDASLKAVNGCTKNIEWLRKEMKIGKTIVPSAVMEHDATEPFMMDGKPVWEDRKLMPDVLVTETMLGPALTDRPTVKDTQKWKAQAEALEGFFLQNAAMSLPGIPVALMLPVWYLRTGPVFLDRVWAAIDKAGYRPVLPPNVQASVPGRISLLYRRPDQVVGREIVLLHSTRRVTT